MIERRCSPASAKTCSRSLPVSQGQRHFACGGGRPSKLKGASRGGVLNLEQRKAHDVFDIPTIPRRQRAQPGEHMWALGRAAPTPLVPTRARSARPRPYRRPGPRRCTPSRRRARSARRRWQPAAAPPGTQARSALGAQRPRRAAPCAERRARSARRRSGSPQAPGAQRPRHRRRARSARRRQLGMLAQPARASSRSSNGRLLPASATLTSFVGGIKTMSPAPGRRPPIKALL